MKSEGRVAAFCAAQRVMRKTWTEPLKERVPVPKSKKCLTDTISKARAAGMSYGQYSAMQRGLLRV